MMMTSSAVSHQEVMGGEAHRGQGWTCRRGGYTQTRSEKETSCSAWWGLTSGRWLPPRPEAPDISRNLPAWMSWSASNTPRHRHQQLCGYAVDRVARLTPTSSAPTSSSLLQLFIIILIMDPHALALTGPAGVLNVDFFFSRFSCLKKKKGFKDWWSQCLHEHHTFC